MSPLVRVIGLGQPVAGDDGVGLAVLDALRTKQLPPHVELCAARDASELTSLLEQVRLAVVVDAALDPGAPGTVRTVTPERLEQTAQSTLSCHGMSVGQALALVRVLQPENAAEVHVVAVGIEPPRRYATELSPEVERAVPEAVGIILKLLREAAHA